SVESVTVRPGLLELFDWAHWNGWVVTVVSNGFDFYVDGVLDALGADRVARHAGRTRHEYRWHVTYYSPRGIELEEGFKLSYAAAFQTWAMARATCRRPGSRRPSSLATRSSPASAANIHGSRRSKPSTISSRFSKPSHAIGPSNLATTCENPRPPFDPSQG
ncbi:MAG TPA: haloacid dehalogenase-like hydrolase, partial [Microthrixaceae bacterium]|nr:haloacid dehalogenase-like hydrolase [Microthrixaceae bacterium]